MNTKLIYRVRKKGTEDFLQLGYNNKSSWLVYPSAAIKRDHKVSKSKEDYEVVVFEYKLEEIKTIELR